MATITIIGGKGQMGSLFSRLWQSQGHAVDSLGEQDWGRAQALLAADLVVVCVPIHMTARVIAKAGPFLSMQTVLADFTSVKQGPVNAMLENHEGPVLGLHPMFGPTIQSTHQQVVIACEGRNPSACEWVIDSLKTLQFTVKQMDAKAHDEAMGFIQGLEHFNTFALGSFLHHKGADMEALLALASPIYKVKLQLLGRIFDQDPGLYADIIMADEARVNLIEAYVKWMDQLLTQLKTKNRDGFIDEFKNAANWMGAFTHDSQLASDVFLDLLTKRAIKP